MQDNDQRKNLNIDSWFAIIIAFIAVAILVFSDFGRNQTVIYDCRDAHWHPDVPVPVREECRRIMIEELEKIREEEKKKNYITA